MFLTLSLNLQRVCGYVVIDMLCLCALQKHNDKTKQE